MAPATLDSKSYNRSAASVAVVGAGISGLAAAYRLKKQGVNVTIFEAEGTVGGKIRSTSEDGLVWDFGPNSMVENEVEVSAIIDDLQLRGKQQFPVLQNRRYILRDNIPYLLPSNPLGLITSKFLSTEAKLRIFFEPFYWKRKPDDSQNVEEESVGEFIGRHFGQETVDYLVDPVLAGTSGSDPASLSVRHTFPDLWALEERYGSLVVGAIKSKFQKRQNSTPAKGSSTHSSQQVKKRGSFSFVGGLQTLANVLAESIGKDYVQLNTELIALSQKEKGSPRRTEWAVSCSVKGSRPKTIGQTFDAVICTVPLDKLKQICISRGGKKFSLDFIPEVLYVPMSLIVTVFRKEDVKRPLQGFGILVPSKAQAQGFQTLGTLFSSSMFPDRAPADQIMFTTFIGGKRHRELASASMEKLQDLVCTDLGKIVGVEGQPVAVKHFFWEKAFPEYGLQYGRVISSIEQLESELPGLFHAGNHRAGLAVGKALASGYQAAGKVLNMLESSDGRLYTMA